MGYDKNLCWGDEAADSWHDTQQSTVETKQLKFLRLVNASKSLIALYPERLIFGLWTI